MAISRTTLLATDQQHSVLQTLSPAGQMPQAYTPYGHSGLASLLGFNGELSDPMTDHYLLGNGYRAFNPVLMRFNSPDSLSPFGKGGLNPYAYCAGDPVNRLDPTGHLSFAGAATVMRAINRFKSPVTTATPAGAFGVFEGTLHLVDKVVRYLPGDDLVSFGLTSKYLKNVVDGNVKPLVITDATGELSRNTVYQLREIALGEAQSHLPSQVLKYRNLTEMAGHTPAGAGTHLEEITNSLSFVRARNARTHAYNDAEKMRHLRTQP